VSLTISDLTAAASSHTHSTANITSFAAEAAKYGPVSSVNTKTGTVTLTVADLTAAAAVHTHSTTDISGFTAAVQSFANVASVQGRTGSVVLTLVDLTAAAASHTHSTANITSFATEAAKYGPVSSVNAKTGAVTLTISDLTAAAASHTHDVSQVSGIPVTSVAGVTGDVSVVGSGGVTVTTSGSSITIYSPEFSGIQWSTPPASPLSLTGAAGDIARDSGYIYLCNGPGDWKRASLSTWAPVDPHFSGVALLLHCNDGSFTDSSGDARTPTVNGSVTGGGSGRFGGSTIFNNSTYFVGETKAYLQYAYDADWDLGNQFTIEFWIYGRDPEESPFRLLLGTAGWGVYITQQSEQDYGTNQRVEIVKFDDDGDVVSRADCGPIAYGQWNYYGISSVAIKSGTQPGGAFSHTNVSNLGLVYGLTAFSSPLTVGGNATNRGHVGGMDEVRITKGVNRVPATVPNAPFPDA
jgi:hypothetical protein